MSKAGPVGWRPIVTAFSIWFAHFLLCWTAVEIWPGQALANQLAWGFTIVALAAMGLHLAGVRRSDRRGELARFTRRFAHGAIAIATVGVLLNAVPSVVFLP